MNLSVSVSVFSVCMCISACVRACVYACVCVCVPMCSGNSGNRGSGRYIWQYIRANAVLQVWNSHRRSSFILLLVMAPFTYFLNDFDACLPVCLGWFCIIFFRSFSVSEFVPSFLLNPGFLLVFIRGAYYLSLSLSLSLF